MKILEHTLATLTPAASCSVPSRLSAGSAHAAPAADVITVAPMVGRLRAGGDNGVPFERWAVGQRFFTARRTIADSDISAFVQLCGYQVSERTCLLCAPTALLRRVREQ
eukprot:SAG11_NODE_1403_length_5007_cov_3.825591_6_plen_109_part_00